jgi:hypothetical protein
MVLKTAQLTVTQFDCTCERCGHDWETITEFSI